MYKNTVNGFELDDWSYQQLPDDRKKLYTKVEPIGYNPVKATTKSEEYEEEPGWWEDDDDETDWDDDYYDDDEE